MEREAILAKLNVFGIEKMNNREKDIHFKGYHEENVWAEEYEGMSGGGV